MCLEFFLLGYGDQFKFGLNVLHSPLKLLSFLLVKVEDVAKLNSRSMFSANAIKVVVEGTEAFPSSFHRLVQRLAPCSEFLQPGTSTGCP